MRLKILFVVFLAAVSLSSCTTFKAVKSNESINGTFRAYYNKNEFDGFFSISKNSLRLDVVNTFGFSIYGVYAQDDSVFLKNYQTGKVYKRLNVNGSDLSQYKPMILYTMRNFTQLCKNNNPEIVVLSCENIDGKKIPSSIIFEDRQRRRLRINLKNIKIKSLRSVK